MILRDKSALHFKCKVFLSAQKKMDEKRTMTGKRIYTGLMGLLLFLAFACTDDRESPGGTNGNPSIIRKSICLMEMGLLPDSSGRKCRM